MLLAIDAGNTNIKLGVFQGPELLANWRLATDTARSADEYGVEIRNLFDQASLNIKGVKAIIVASVIPQLNETLKGMSERYLQLTPVFVDHTTNTGLTILYDQPSELGVDRIVGAVAAVEKYGAPCVVVDFGTATTFNAINSKREYLGGIIIPGIMTFADSLFSRTAKLPRVSLEPPANVIGRSTVEAIQSGIFFGYGTLVDGLLEHLLHAMQEAPKVIATGGLARVIDQELHFIYEFDQNLTLDGLRIVYELNKT